jgi:hypothetical protein
VGLLPEIQALLERQAASGRPPLQEQSVDQARRFHAADAALQDAATTFRVALAPPGSQGAGPRPVW